MSSTRKMWGSPVKATYTYKVKNWGDNTYSTFSIEVDVLGETKRKYVIRLLGLVPHHNYGDIIEVFKEHVKIPREIDVSGFWYNNLEKDDE